MFSRAKAVETSRICRLRADRGTLRHAARAAACVCDDLYLSGRHRELTVDSIMDRCLTKKNFIYKQTSGELFSAVSSQNVYIVETTCKSFKQHGGGLEVEPKRNGVVCFMKFSFHLHLRELKSAKLLI